MTTRSALLASAHVAGAMPLTRRNLLRRSLGAGVVLGTPALAAACRPRSAPPAPTGPAAPGPAPVTITFWGHNHVPRVNLDTRLFEEWKQRAPQITVEYTVVPQEYEVKLTTAMAGGVGPDFFNLTTSYNYTFMARSFATPVEVGVWGLRDQASFERLYVAGTLEGFKYQGKLYGVPSEVSNYAPFINRAMFQEVGLDPARDYPKTWEEMIPVAAKLTRREGDTLVRRGFDFTYMTPQGRWTSPLHTFLGMAYQLGGEPFTPDLQRSLLDGEPFVEALQYQYDWIYRHRLGSPTLLGSNQAFARGENAMTLLGFWAFATLQGQYPDVYAVAGAFPFPQFQRARRKSGAVLYGYAWMVNANARGPQRDAAWQTIKFLSDHPEEYLAEAGLLQPKLALTQSAVFRSLPYIDVFLKDAEGTPFTIRHHKGIEITNAITRGMERVTQEGASPKQSLEQTKQEVDALLRES